MQRVSWKRRYCKKRRRKKIKGRLSRWSPSTTSSTGVVPSPSVVLFDVDHFIALRGADPRSHRRDDASGDLELNYRDRGGPDPSEKCTVHSNDSIPRGLALRGFVQANTGLRAHFGGSDEAFVSLTPLSS